MQKIFESDNLLDLVNKQQRPFIGYYLNKGGSTSQAMSYQWVFQFHKQLSFMQVQTVVCQTSSDHILVRQSPPFLNTIPNIKFVQQAPLISQFRACTPKDQNNTRISTIGSNKICQLIDNNQHPIPNPPPPPLLHLTYDAYNNNFQVLTNMIPLINCRTKSLTKIQNYTVNHFSSTHDLNIHLKIVNNLEGRAQQKLP